MGLLQFEDGSGANLILCGIVILITGWATKEIVFSPLRVFPGPFIARFTDVWRALWVTKGDIDSTHLRWHRKYDATAVRIGPNTVSIGDPDLIRVIYSTKDPWKKVSLTDVWVTQVVGSWKARTDRVVV